jgi:hypothetical protein
MRLLVVALLTVTSLGGWWFWFAGEGRNLGPYRRWASAVGLVGLSAATGSYMILVSQLGHLSEPWGVIGWAVPSFWTSLISVVCCSFGRGKSRVLGCLGSVLALLVWALPGLDM